MMKTNNFPNNEQLTYEERVKALMRDLCPIETTIRILLKNVDDVEKREELSEMLREVMK